MTKPRRDKSDRPSFVCLIRGEVRMSNVETNPNAQMIKRIALASFCHSVFELPSSLVIRHLVNEVRGPKETGADDYHRITRRHTDYNTDLIRRLADVQKASAPSA